MQRLWVQDKANLMKTTEENGLLWHKRLGQLHQGYLNQIIGNKLATGINLDAKVQDLPFCQSCCEGKLTRLAFPKGQATRAQQKLEIIHSDVCGPIKPTSLGGSSYYVSFIDDKTRFTVVYLMSHKGQVLEKFKEYKARMENESGQRIKTLRSDNGGEYISGAFKRFLQDHGIRQETTVPYTPQQNGVAERANRTIMEMTRSMIYGAKLVNKGIWGEAVSTAVYIKNRTPTAAVQGKTPFEAWTGRKPSLEHLRVFGCPAYAHIPQEKRTKLDAKAIKCIMVGYSNTQKAYRLYQADARKIIVSRDVTFDESFSSIGTRK